MQTCLWDISKWKIICILGFSTIYIQCPFHTWKIIYNRSKSKHGKINNDYLCRVKWLFLFLIIVFCCVLVTCIEPILILILHFKCYKTQFIIFFTLIPQDQDSPWLKIFFMMVANNVISLIFYLIFAKAEIQDWAKETQNTYLWR